MLDTLKGLKRLNLSDLKTLEIAEQCTDRDAPLRWAPLQHLIWFGLVKLLINAVNNLI